MKKLYLVPHMHWDREWYFSSDTANVLFHSNIKEMISVIKDQKQFLDGQWSLLDDYLKSAPEDKEKIKKLLKSKKISSGPFYSQPDVLNSQAETIIRNIETGENVAKELNVENPKTAYLPDTFGFGKNLINIFNEKNIDNFVFWRGLPKEEVEKSVLFKWTNENASINSLCLKDGYYSVGMYFPYNGQGGQYPEKWDPKKFAEKLQKRMKEVNGFKDTYIFPLGGDQAPFIHNQKDFLSLVQKEMPDVKISLLENYDQFFEENKIDKKYEDNLLEPFTGKIHRTIASSRYDIKKLFRDAENKLYGQLEPLEVYFKSLDPLYDFEKYKEEKIIKPLLIAQTHDSLGACNTDSTNYFQVSRLLAIHENIDSQIDLIIKRIMQHKNAFGEEFLIFNPSMNKNHVFTRKTIFSARMKEINIDTKNLKIRTLKSTNISYSEKTIYKIDAIIFVDNLKPLQEIIVDPMKFEQVKFNKMTKQGSAKSFVELADVNLKLECIEDKGDSYDFSPGEKLPLDQKHKVTNVWKLENSTWTEIESSINWGQQSSTFIWNIFNYDGEEKVVITTDNKLKNVRVSLKINDQAIRYSQNLGMLKVVNEKVPNNWKEYLHEYPVNVFLNDGLIVGEKTNILTFGNNEMYSDEKSTTITLFRTYQNVTAANMEWRPSTSGLSWEQASPDSQLQKELQFEFVFANTSKVNKLANTYRFVPYIYKTQTRNFIAHKMSKFVINNIFNPKDERLNISAPKDMFISSFRPITGGVEIRVANLSNTLIKDKIVFNSQEKSISLKPNQIKTITFKGENNE